MDRTLRVQLSPKLDFEHRVGAIPPEISPTQVVSLETDIRELVRLDAAIKSLEERKEGCKQRIAQVIGTDVPYLHYRGKKRWWKVRLYVNFELVPALVQAKLAKTHPDILKKCLVEGVSGRFIVPATKQTQRQVEQTVKRAITSLKGVTRYIGTQLGPLLYESALIAVCKKQGIDLEGTFGQRVTAYVEEETPPTP